MLDFVPGTLLFDAADPDGDDNGRGNYAYPTSSSFHAGAFDMERLQVFDAGDPIAFRVQTRDLSPTFGSALGAQLVDVYVHEPAAPTTSTAPSFPQSSYQIAAGSAWSKLLGVVDEAADGAGALAAVARARPDLVLMDVRMTGVDGIEATRRVRALPAPRE